MRNSINAFASVNVIQFPKVKDARGNLTFIQYEDQCPFPIERVFLTYDVPGGGVRGGHAYFEQNEIIIALSGSFDVVISSKDGDRFHYSLNRSYYGLYIPAKTWRHLENFSTNALSLHLSSTKYNPDDYLRDFQLYSKTS